MREKMIGWFAYLWAGFTGVVSGLSINETGVVVSIAATLFTAVINWLYRRRMLKALQNHPDVRKAYKQMEDD